MFSIVLTALAVCGASLAIGQLILFACGAPTFSWLAASVGAALMFLIAVTAIHVPGRVTTIAVLIALLTIAGAVLWLREPSQRPPMSGLVAALPVAGLTLVPFIAAGRAGTLGVSFDNDMAAHLLLAESYRSQAVENVTSLVPADYPLGPHALAAVFAQGFGVRVDLAFAGLTAAAPMLIALTAIAAVRKSSWAGRMLVATVTGMPFLIAAYYGEGSFKEVLQALFVLATALALAGFGPIMAGRRWVPLAMIGAGTVAVYSLPGLAWPVGLLAVVLAGNAISLIMVSGMPALRGAVRRNLAPAALAIAAFAVVLVPQIPRVHRFLSNRDGTGIDKNDLGNLVGALPGWEAFGVWNNPDFRLPADPAFGAGMWTAFVLGLVVLGIVWSVRQGNWMLGAAPVTCMLIWAVSTHGQSPYVAAKALVIASPLLLLLASITLAESHLSPPPWWRFAVPLLAVALLVRVVDSSWEAARFSKVGPTEHLEELRALRSDIGGRPTLFLGNDDFLRWELAGVPVTAPYIGFQVLPLNASKGNIRGQAFDFDTVDAAAINAVDWVIKTRDAASSEVPDGLKLERTTRSFELWRRVSRVADRKTLAEGDGFGAVLDCDTPEGRKISAGSGVAAIRDGPVGTPLTPLLPGASSTVRLTLPAGRWELSLAYTSPHAIDISWPGQKVTMPANLDRPGPRWRVGAFTLARQGVVPVIIKADETWLTPRSAAALPTNLVAMPMGPARQVPLSEACDQIVDWYR